MSALLEDYCFEISSKKSILSYRILIKWIMSTYLLIDDYMPKNKRSCTLFENFRVSNFTMKQQFLMSYVRWKLIHY